jgi:hypothetical protein
MVGVGVIQVDGKRRDRVCSFISVGELERPIKRSKRQLPACARIRIVVGQRIHMKLTGTCRANGYERKTIFGIGVPSR